MTPGASWASWGDPYRATDLPDPARNLVEAAFGPLTPSHAIPAAEVRLPEHRLTDRVLQDLEDLLGPAQVRTDPEARGRHTRGKSTPDLVLMRRGDAADAPDAVLLPGGHDDVVAVLDLCSRKRLAVVPFGGGTSVVGGVTAARDGLDGVVAVDLSRLDRLRDIDAESGTAVLEAGVLGPRAEELLRPHGLTLGHFPQSFEHATIGGFAATRSSGQASAGYGRFDAAVVSLRVATPGGEWVVGHAPASAAGPDLRQLVLGSEGALGVITEVRVRVRPLPEQTVYRGWRVASFETGRAAVRALARSADRPSVIRLSDEVETAINLPRPSEVGSASSEGSLLVVGVEGSSKAVARQESAVAETLSACGATDLGSAVGEAWAAGRYDAPYLRDSLLDAGVYVETLETAGFWSALPGLYDGVRTAVQTGLAAGSVPVVVMAHVSHVYETGASLYFTAATRLDDTVLDRWRSAKSAATDAIVAAGGTISHHHGVGRDHRPWLRHEIGSVGVRVLRAVKAEIDPVGILNPGVLVP